MLMIGLAIIVFMMFGWFGQVINESEPGLYNEQVDVSFRWGMGWFIFSEVMFFAAFFGALFYARNLSVPWLGGEGAGASYPRCCCGPVRGGLADQRPGPRSAATSRRWALGACRR